MERTTAFVLKEPVVLSRINEENLKEQDHLQQLRERYTNKKLKQILESRKSHNSLSAFTQRRSIEAITQKGSPTLDDYRSSRRSESKRLISLEKIMKDLNIRPPNPRSRFYEYLSIAPPSRDIEHIKTIKFYLQQYRFIQCHPLQIHQQLSANMVLKQGGDIMEWDIPIVQNPIRIHKQFQQRGFIVNHKDIVPKESYLCIDKTKYKGIVQSYFDGNFDEIYAFITKLELLRSVEELLLKKISKSAELIFKMKGESLYTVQDPADKIFVVYKGRVARKVIIEIEKNNILPLQKEEILTSNAVYQVEIQFKAGDIVGYLQFLEDPCLPTRCQNVEVVQNSILLCIDYEMIKKLKHANLKWFKKQRAQKYPKSYQDLCNHYDKKIRFNRKVKQMARGTLKQEKRGSLALDAYKVKNIKYVRSYSNYKPRKSIVY